MKSIETTRPIDAPPEVVATEKERIAQFEKVNSSLARQIEIVQGLVGH